MRDLILASGLLLLGFLAMCLSLTQKPHDFRSALMENAENSETLSAALQQALEDKKMHVPVNIPR